MNNKVTITYEDRYVILENSKYFIAVNSNSCQIFKFGNINTFVESYSNMFQALQKFKELTEKEY